ncbi:ATP-binding protein [Paraliomyxa miuraensis]|uniref:ATP-binding protein n=1 Tax=Paraliomyxa miuraensis TaxID=376150 RepID=UPI00225A5C7B|nr:ATP-binding protein [Paraliomyxa miuraensis]MCX4239618.1 ATP-binding protein [Paraliomyxa miuraensis]
MRPDYRGARGSNAGDDFHELWALYRSLELLDPKSDLLEVTVEGVAPDDEAGTTSSQWDGVDCAFYRGDRTTGNIAGIEIEQLKYSGASPSTQWTVSALCSTSKSKRSVLGRLAEVFGAIADKYPELARDGGIVVRLVSNRPASQDLLDAMLADDAAARLPSDRAQARSENRRQLRGAARLPTNRIQQFMAALDSSGYGRSSRFEIESKCVELISGSTWWDARPTTDALLRLIANRMGPEGNGKTITYLDLYTALGFADPSLLFPCPPKFRDTKTLVERRCAETIGERLREGARRVCIHGPAGSGKTTLVRLIENRLPKGSAAVLYDCYGEGDYLQSTSRRDIASDAFMQICNELAEQLHLPLLLTDNVNARTLAKRVELAASALQARDPDAVLLIAIDAADNALAAAKRRTSGERSFVRELIDLGKLPDNVRLMVTCRGSRLADLNLPDDWLKLEISVFDLRETKKHVQLRYPTAAANDEWLREFHALTHGTPRVQSYVFDEAAKYDQDPILLLQPDGKTLDALFEERLEEAANKHGEGSDFANFCASLVQLPRPTPARVVAATTGLQELQVMDICHDLQPAVVIDGQDIGLADEDFEDFLRVRGTPAEATTYASFANYVLANHASDAYAATHLHFALIADGRERELLAVVQGAERLDALKDPVLRRRTQLSRLQTAMRCAQDLDDPAEAALTLLLGAHALRSGRTINRALSDNPDLAVAFFEDSIRHEVLRDPQQIATHGEILLHSLVNAAERRSRHDYLHGYQHFVAWLKRREVETSSESGHGRSWPISDRAVLANIEAVLEFEGPEEAVDALLRWRPPVLQATVAIGLSCRLATRGKFDMLRNLADAGARKTPWNAIPLIALALAGQAVDPHRLGKLLRLIARFPLVNYSRFVESYGDQETQNRILEFLLSGAEIALALGCRVTDVDPLLRILSAEQLRGVSQMSSVASSAAFDASARAVALREALDGRALDTETYWMKGERTPSDRAERQAQARREEEVRRFYAPYLALYRLRAAIILGSASPDALEVDGDRLLAELDAAERNTAKEYWARVLRARLATALIRLAGRPGLDPLACMRLALATASGKGDDFEAPEKDWWRAAGLQVPLHGELISHVGARAKAVAGAPAPATARIAALTDFARVLLPFSQDDAEAIFTDALELGGDTDADDVHELTALAAAAVTGRAGLDDKLRGQVARQLAQVVAKVAKKLPDDFPWHTAVRAIAVTRVADALAAIGRWHDEGTVSLDDTLPSAIQAALSTGQMSGTVACSLVPLLSNPGSLLIKDIASSVVIADESTRRRVAAQLAHHELIEKVEPREAVTRAVLGLCSAPANEPQVEALARTADYYRKILALEPRSSSKPAGQEHTSAGYHTDAPNANAAAMEPDAESIRRCLDGAIAEAEARNDYVRTSTHLANLRRSVTVKDRARFLDGIRTLASDATYEHNTAMVEELCKSVRDWFDGSPAVRRWCADRLMTLVEDSLPRFAEYYDGHLDLAELLNRSTAPGDALSRALLRGLSRHAGTLTARSLYELVALWLERCSAKTAAAVLLRFVDTLAERQGLVPMSSAAPASHEPSTEVATSRFLFAMLGDTDSRIRWRSAHSLRWAATLGEHSVVQQVLDRYHCRAEDEYRDSGAPFFWLGARLWLLIAAERIALDRPGLLHPHAELLKRIANDQSLPHLLLQRSARRALALLKPGTDGPADDNASPEGSRANDASATSPSHEELQVGPRRFDFDPMDTIPYWYSPASDRIGLRQDEFLAKAERWIVNEWGFTDAQRNAAYARISRRIGGNRYDLWAHRHGDQPIVELWETHLEWHAMWCVLGSLATNADNGLGERGTVDDFAGIEELSAPPYWLADLLGPVPLEDAMRAPPRNDLVLWGSDAAASDFTGEIGIEGEWVTVYASYSVESESSLSCAVASALVAPDTAPALVRALQTAEHFAHYRLPPAGNRLEFDNPPYRLLGWLDDTSGASIGIDGLDPLAHGHRPPPIEPSADTCAALNLEKRSGRNQCWRDAVTSERVFELHSWSSRPAKGSSPPGYRDNRGSDGFRLVVRRKQLLEFLRQRGLDLILEVRFDRRSRAYDQRSYGNDEEVTESQARKILLLRRDGTVEDEAGRVGTGEISGP